MQKREDILNEVLRQEKKFLISLDQMYRYRHTIGKIMTEDQNNGEEGYRIRSLYFDTLEDQDFEDKEDGLELRRKIRLRCYDPTDDFGVLEMKQKQGAMQKKRSLKMTRADAVSLTKGDYGVLLKYGEPFAGECYYLMNSRCYVPKAVVEYRRKAFIAKENKIRITFDHHLIGTEACFDIFDNRLLQYPIMDPCLAVLEVKYNGFLLSYLKDMLRECDKSEISVSKYCMGRAVSKHYQF